MKQEGFTLLELIIALLIIGVIATGGTLAVKSALNSGKYAASRNQIESFLKDVAQYSGRARIIPAQSEIAQVIQPMIDSFGKNLYYYPVPELTTPADSTGDYIQNICTQSVTGLTVRHCPETSCGTPTAVYDNVAFFVSSGSANKNIQIDNTDTDDTYPAVINTIDIYDMGIIADGYSADGTTAETYDDLTGFMTLNTLKRYAGCAPRALNIIEPELPAAYAGSEYSFSLNPIGGTGPYRWCVESSETSVQSEIYYAGNSVEPDCSNAVYAPFDTLTIDSNGTAVASDTYLTSSKLRVFLVDSRETSVERDFVFKVFQKGGFAPDSITELTQAAISIDDLVTAGENDPDNTGQTSNHNKHLIDISEDKISFNSDGSRFGSACVWYPGDTGLEFKDRFISAYFEYDPTEISSELDGFTFAVIRERRPDGSGGEVSTENDCGDTGPGIGYAAYGTRTAKALYGEGFALELDSRTQNSSTKFMPDKKDPEMNHIAIVSYNAGYAYNVHDSAENDECTSSGGNGCYYDSSILNEQKSYVRVEAYHGCSDDGTLCSESGDHICVYGWHSTDPNPYLSNTGVGYILSGDTSPVGNPTVQDCYKFTTGSLNNVRPGFTFTKFNHDLGNELDIDNFSISNFRLERNSY